MLESATLANVSEGGNSLARREMRPVQEDQLRTPIAVADGAVHRKVDFAASPVVQQDAPRAREVLGPPQTVRAVQVGSRPPCAHEDAVRARSMPA